MQWKEIMTGCVAATMVTAVSGMAMPSHAAVIDHNDVTYVIDPATPAYGVSSGLNDPGGDALADGVVATLVPSFADSQGGSNEGWVEFAPDASRPSYAGISPLIHFDLGAAYDLETLEIIYFRRSSGRVGDPVSLTVSFSDDGVTFSDPVTVPLTNPGTVDREIVTQTIGLTGYSGRYVDVAIDLAADNSWTFVTELTFEGSLVPEPASLGLLALGGLAMLGRRRG